MRTSLPPDELLSDDLVRYLDTNGKPVQDLPDFAQDHEVLLQLYRSMMLIRTMDNKAVTLQRMGKMGTYPACRGQEAIPAATGHAMATDDVFCPYYRDQSTLIFRGVAIDQLFAVWGGDERGNCFVNDSQDLPMCVPIADQCLHAAGVAFAMQYRQQQRATLVGIGDGGTSRGDFYEAVNLAGVWRLPLVFLVNNNQWAISVPVAKQTACENFAQKAVAGGIPAVRVDGNDVIAVRHVVSQALARARRGEGATLIEAVTYRLCDHTTADDATRYQPQQEVRAAEANEPLIRLREYLTRQGVWSPAQETELQQACKAEVDQAAELYLNRPKAPATDMFDYLYANLPDALLDQRDEVEGLT